MKRPLILAVLLLIVLTPACRKQQEGEAVEVEKPQPVEQQALPPLAKALDEKLDQALLNLEGGNPSAGAVMLVDALLAAKPREQWPAGFEYAVSAAREQFDKGDFERGVKSVTEALALVRPPAGVSAVSGQAAKREEVPAVADIFKNRIASVKTAFRQGDADGGVIRILEALLLLSPISD